MYSKIEQRKNVRLAFKNNIQYAKMNKDGSYGTPISTIAHDIGVNGISFYTSEEFELNSQVRISCHVSEEEQVSFIARIVRMQISEIETMKYMVGVEIVSIAEKDKEKIIQFLTRINFSTILAGIDLTQVMDIHIISGYPPIIKKVGKLEHTGTVIDEYTVRNLLINTMNDDHYERFTRDKDINFVFFYKDKRLRANIHFQQGKIAGVFRLVPSEIRGITQLGLPEAVEKLLENRKGLILVAGRTGSGKTTTLASMIESLNNDREGIVVSIEDPIEYVHVNKKCFIKQREIGKDTISYAMAVKNALRQNPDVLVIGEILDGPTMEIAMTAAESGTLVLTTIHAPNSAQALDRVSSFFPPDMQKHIFARLSLMLKGIITQELFPRLDGKELVPAVEVLVMNDPARKIIRDGDWKQIPNIVQTGRSLGMQTMQDSIEQLVRKGLIDIQYLREFL
jgi:twitching motility protein PilT